MPTATWRCACGATGLTVDIAPASGTRIVCHCADCRAFARITGHAATLDPAGGLDLFQTTPDRLVVTRGAGNLGCLRLTPRGPLRWTAACCATPLAVTPAFRAIPFSSLTTAGFADPAPLGRIRAHAFVKAATAPVPRPHGSLIAVLAAFARRTLATRLAGRHVATPFFDVAGRPVAAPASPDPATLAAAYA